MDQQKFLELLQNIQVPDTELVKTATTELRKFYYPNPGSLVLLIHFLTSHDAPEIRQQAAVEALRIVDRHWDSISPAQKPEIRDKLLQFTMSEQKALVCHSAARLIAAIARIDFRDGQWTQLPGLLAQASSSDLALHREMATFILYSLLEETHEMFEGKIPDLFQLFSHTIRDPESADVRINTLLCLGRIAMSITSDEDQANIERLNEIFPQMVEVLKSAIQEDNEDRIMQAFDIFQGLLGCVPAILNKHFKDLMQFMTEISADTNISDDSRTQALSFLMQCAKYRKMKIQGLKDMGELLTLKSLQIATEIDDDSDDDDDDKVTPSKSALGLLDMLATSLPPRQVIVPLLKVLPQYVQSENPKYRQAGILALGMCVEGAPDFIGTQLDNLMQFVFRLLDDPEIRVRGAALNSIARLADDLAEDLCKHHKQLIPALLKNLEASSLQSAYSGPEAFKNLDVLKSSCSALDSVCRGIDKKTMIIYISELVTHVGGLLSHPDLNVKASAAGALGSIAESAEDAFLPYFETSMKVLSEYVSIKNSSAELDLRGIVCDAMGSLATAVGPEVFKPYVNPLMQASEEGLQLCHPRLRETSYILWSTLAKVYEADFTPFLDGVAKGLFDCLEQDEADLDLVDGVQELLGEEVVVAGNKVKAATDENVTKNPHFIEDDDASSWDDDFANNAVAMEKEVAIEVLGDVISHTRRNFMPYFEKAIVLALGFVEHGYDGVRKGAISTLWRSYACHWALMEDESGEKWTPGLPLKQQPSSETLKLGELMTTATIELWESETNRAVVTDINRNVAATLKLCGPAILTHNNFTERTIATCTAMITKSHPCLQDFGDGADCFDLENEESSEYDWLVVDTALDSIIGLSKALGGQFAEAWKIFQKPIMKFASSPVNYERSTAVGVIAECTASMGEAITPYTKVLLALLLHRLGDEDAETKSNSAFALGQLVFHSTDSNEYLGSYMTILSKLEPLLQTSNARALDNAAGCVCRMIMAHIDHVPVSEIMPVIVELLPLKEDYEENLPIYDCITGLYQQSHPTILALTPKLIPVFASALGEPKEQLEPSTRTKIIDTLKFIADKEPSLVHGNEALLMALNG